jgi:hypothetical protein
MWPWIYYTCRRHNHRPTVLFHHLDVILYCKALCFALFEHYNLLLWNWMENGLIWHGSDYGRSVNNDVKILNSGKYLSYVTMDLLYLSKAQSPSYCSLSSLVIGLLKKSNTTVFTSRTGLLTVLPYLNIIIFCYETEWKMDWSGMEVTTEGRLILSWIFVSSINYTDRYNMIKILYIVTINTRTW